MQKGGKSKNPEQDEILQNKHFTSGVRCCGCLEDVVLSEQTSSGTSISRENRLREMLELTQIHDQEGMDSSQNTHHEITGEHLSAQEEKPCCGACKLKEHP